MLLLPGRFHRVFVNVGPEGFEVCIRRDPGNLWPQPTPSVRLICQDGEALRAVVLNALKVDGLTRFVGEGLDGPQFQYVPAKRSDLADVIGRLSTSGPKSVTLIVTDGGDEVMVERIADAHAALRRMRPRVTA